MKKEKLKEKYILEDEASTNLPGDRYSVRQS
jgi:hypothetical protein